MRPSRMQSSSWPSLRNRNLTNISSRTAQSNPQPQFSFSIATAESVPPANAPLSPASSTRTPAPNFTPRPLPPQQPSPASYSNAQSATVPAKAYGSANPVAVLSAARTQNTSLSGNGERDTCLLSAVSVWGSARAIVEFRAAVAGNVLRPGKSSRKPTAMLRMLGRLIVLAGA